MRTAASTLRVHDFVASLLVCALVLLWSGAAHAQSVVAQVATTKVFVSEPLRVTVKILNLEAFDGPSFEEVTGLEIKRLPGEQTSVGMTTVNGRMRQQRTVSLNFEVLATAVGEFTIPAFAVDAGGVRYESKPIEISVAASDGAKLLMVRVVGEPSTIYLGQQGVLNLEVLIRPFNDAALGITLDEQSMWSLLDMQGSTWGVFGPALQKMLSENRRPRGELRVVDDEEFLVFSVSKPFDPIAAGTPAVGEIRVRMEYPTRLQRGNDFLFQSRLSLAGSRSMSATPDSTRAIVLPLPEGGRPAGFNGAVGSFEILVVAKPHEVAVGDPITLTMRLTDTTGSAELDGLQAPLLAPQSNFASGFRISSEPAAGTVEGRSKIFTQSIRALGEAVREIPAIEFPYFDPSVGEYKVARSIPIAITVKPSAIVRLASDESAGDSQINSTKPAFTKVEGGVLANASIEECLTRETVTPTFMTVTAAIPIALALVPLLVARARRDRDPRAQRHARARHELERALAAAHDAPPDAATLEALLLEYFASRLGVASEGFSRKDVLALLELARVDPQLVEETDQLLRRCERARYLGEAVTTNTVLNLAHRVDAVTPFSGLATERTVA